MNLLIFTGSVSRSAGGTFDAIRRPAQTLFTHFGVAVRIIGVNDSNSQKDLSEWLPLEPDLFSCIGPNSFGYAPAMASHLNNISPELVHTHGIWMYHSYVSRKYCHKNEVPYVISPHGMLDPWALKNSGWKKKVVSALNENDYLRGASCLHSLCNSETLAMRKYGLGNYICQIPNGVDINSDDHQFDPPWQKDIAHDKKVLLFLGRIHPKKGLANLIHSWRSLQNYNSAVADEWSLVIAGWDQLGHENELKKMCQHFDIENSVCFAGPLFGVQKNAAYQNAAAYILPSFSEGLPMTILEAWAYKLPVLMTQECHIPEGFEANAAIEIQPDADSVFEGLLKLVSMTESSLNEIGENGFDLVNRKFTWEKIARQMSDVYNWILGGGTPPSCVRVD